MKLTWRHWVNPEGGGVTGRYHEFRSWRVYSAYYDRLRKEVNDPKIRAEKADEKFRAELRLMGVHEWPIDWETEYRHSLPAKYSNDEDVQVGDEITLRMPPIQYRNYHCYVQITVKEKMPLRHLFQMKEADKIEKRVVI